MSASTNTATGSPHLTGRTSRLKGFATRVEHAAGRLGRWAHAREDEQALSQGWQVTHERWGGRTYRHPGWTASQSMTAGSWHRETTSRTKTETEGAA